MGGKLFFLTKKADSTGKSALVWIQPAFRRLAGMSLEVGKNGAGFIIGAITVYSLLVAVTYGYKAHDLV